MISWRALLLVLIAFLLVGIVSGCSLLRPPVPCECRISPPPPELMRVPPALPPIPADLPRART